jgi:hypothetical protein
MIWFSWIALDGGASDKGYRRILYGVRSLRRPVPPGCLWLVFGKAWVDQGRCTLCYNCIGVCPQGAIREEVKVSLEDVKAFLNSLHGKANSIMSRIDGITQKDRTS